MATELTNNTQRALKSGNIQPTIAFVIDGIDYVFSSGSTKEYIKIGDEGFEIGDDWYIGGFREIEGNQQLIDSGTTTYSIRQQMNYDEGEGNSISTMTVGLVDKDGFVTNLITPDPDESFDVLGRKAKIYLGFGTTSFGDDYMLIFQGYITEISSKSGVISFKINHPDNKKKISLFKNFTTSVAVNLQSSDLTLDVDSTDGFLDAVPDFLDTYLVIDNEVIKYTVSDSNTLTIVRGQMGTTAAQHAVGSEVTSLYALKGNPMDIALAIMLSGSEDPFVENIPIESFVKKIPGPGLLFNSIFFKDIDLKKKYNIQVGDLITVTGASSSPNNVTDRTIMTMNLLPEGTVIQVSGSPLGYELNSSAVMSVVSQYQVFAEGMNLKPEDVDIDQHLFIRDFFHPSTEYRLLVKEDIDNGKDFLDEQIYKPIACFSLPRKGQCSVGYSIGPIPGAEIKTLNINNLKDPKNLRIARTTGRAFFNEVIYKYDVSPITDKYLQGYGIISQTSKDRIAGSSRAYKVEANGIQSDLNGANIVQSEAQRVIDRYKYAAETIYCSALLSAVVDSDIGDVILFEGTNLSISDITNGTRNFKPRLMEIRNRELNLKTGDVSLELLDTGQNVDTRYGLMSPVSQIASVISQEKIIITFCDNYPSRYGVDEYRNWASVMDLQDGIPVRIRDAGFTFEELAIVDNIAENVFTFRDELTTPLTVGMIIEFVEYNDASEKEKLVYAFMADAAEFDDEEPPYSMI